MIDATRGEGLYSAMSEAWPKPMTPSVFAISASGAVESVCCAITSTPCSIIAFAASASFAGSNQV
jgi:hypothetical protein